MRKRISILIGIILILTFDYALAGGKKAVSFSGDILISGADSTVTAKLYVKDKYVYRVEMSKDAGGMIFIQPQNARGKIWMLDPAEKQYRVLSWPEKHQDPVSAWTDIQYDMQGGVAGKEELRGHPCTIYEFKYPNRDEIALKMWFAEDVAYTIKRKANAKIAIAKGAEPIPVRGTFQVLNIQTKALDNTLFEIPAGYTEVK